VHLPSAELRQLDNHLAEQQLRLAPNIPNTVTAVRVVLAGIIPWFLCQEEFLIAGILLIIAASTDGLDGLLARKLRQSSLGGAIFDLLADQILLMTSLVLAITARRFSRTDSLMPFSPYPYAVLTLAGGAAVLVGVSAYFWLRRSRTFEFPTPTLVSKVNYWFCLAPLVVAILGIGPDWLLVALMYCAVISTVLSFYSYLKKGISILPK
jgi:phosphatidylglycerophosphate synthase